MAGNHDKGVYNPLNLGVLHFRPTRITPNHPKSSQTFSCSTHFPCFLSITFACKLSDLELREGRVALHVPAQGLGTDATHLTPVDLSTGFTMFYPEIRLGNPPPKNGVLNGKKMGKRWENYEKTIKYRGFQWFP